VSDFDKLELFNLDPDPSYELTPEKLELLTIRLFRKAILLSIIK
jgi:hypothetical protein